MQYEAVRLFMERAAAAQPAFRITAANGPVVAEICRRLDGLPLAIELAAAWMNVLALEQLALRMDDLWRLSSRGRRTVMPHQQTLRATLDWSHDLLAEPERTLLRRSSVFVGGWNLEAAEAICSDWGLHIAGNPSTSEAGSDGFEGPVDSRSPFPLCASVAPSLRGTSESVIYNEEVLVLLTGLVEKSLVVAERGVGEAGGSAEVRYRLLETVRQYARERLVETDERKAARVRHQCFFLALAERAEPELQGPDQIAWLNRLEAEYENLRMAMRCANEAGDAEIVLRFGAALWPFWHWREHRREGIEWLERGLAAGAEVLPRPLRARALLGLAMMYWQADDSRVSATLEEALRLFRELSDLRGISHSLCWLGRYRTTHGNGAQGQALGEEAVSVARQAGDRYLIAHSLWLLGMNLQGRGELDQAAALLAESAAVSRQLGNPQLLAVTLQTWGAVARDQGEWRQAAALLAEGEPIFRKLGLNWFLACALLQRAELVSEMGDQRTASALLEESLAISRDLSRGLSTARVLRHLGDAARREGDDEKACSLYEESLALARAEGTDQVIAWCLCGMALMAVRHGAAEYAHSLACESLTIFRDREERLWEREFRRGVLRCLEALAQVAYAQGQLERMARLFGAAEAQREVSHWRLPPADQADYAALPAARAALGEAAFAAAWAEGRAMALDQAIASAMDLSDSEPAYAGR
jgi:non-specific serine/threonine protein kinase